MTRRMMIAAALLSAGSLFIAACDKGKNRIPAAASLSLGTVPPSTTTTSIPSPTTTVSAQIGALHAIGELVTTATGNELTLHAWDRAVPGIASQSPGGLVAAADVEACARRAAANIGDTQFELSLADGHTINRMIGGRQPPLGTASLPPGGCVRGWVTFSVPSGGVPSELVFRGSSVIRWSLT